MANKSGKKRRGKRELKKIKNLRMANCRRVAVATQIEKQTDECFQNQPVNENVCLTGDQLEANNTCVDDSISSDNQVEHNLKKDDNFASDKPLLAVLKNVYRSNSPTDDEQLNKNKDIISPNNGIELDLNAVNECFAPKCKKPQDSKKQKKCLRKVKSKEAKPEAEKKYDAKERLIIDKEYFFEKLKIISNHSPQFGCNLSNLNITGETKTGLNSKLKLTCNMCKAVFFVNTSDPQPTENLDINTAAVAAVTNAGIGLEQFQGLCAAMNLPIMTQKMYAKKHIEICEQWEKTAHQTMAAAAERERLAAIKEGRVKDGIAVIDVIADACWSKRSYKKNYSALSGAAAIVGRKFGEVLFLGVKNKYCCICVRAQNKGIAPKDHICFKNYTGSSSGMEAAIIAEGFKSSIDMYNVIYGRVIADGDSNTYARILQERPYKDVTVEKIECRNHIFRNMCNKLVFVSNDTKYPLYMRKMLTTQRILAIRKVICLAIKKHKDDTAELGTRINNLYIDISNSYNHAFGDHSQCLDHYCCSEKKSENLIPKVKSSTFWSRIQYIVGIVATHSRSLINDFDSNAVEQFNSIIAKFVGGKRTNLVQRQTYQSRCAAAVVAYNTKSPLYTLQKSLLGKSPKSKTKSLENKIIHKNKLRRNFKTVRKNIFIKKVSPIEDKNYGATCEKPDMERDVYELAKQSFLTNLKRSDDERSRIERSTILQRDSSEWLELRRNLLTASNFGKIIKRRPTTSGSIVKSLLYKSDISHITSIKHGVDHEMIALSQLAKQEGVKIKPCGLFIDSKVPFLAATPDGLIDNDTIVEIKCPLSAFKMPIRDAIEKRKIKFWEIKDGKIIVNKNDSWYYQIQGQLHITERQMCLFAVWSGENQKLTIEKIFRDDAFWDKKMIGKLTEFYMEHILPELIDPRQTRNMKFRQPLIPKKRHINELTEARPAKLANVQSVAGESIEGPSELESSCSTNLGSAGPSNITDRVLGVFEY